MAAEVWYAHPDGVLRRIPGGELGPTWGTPAGLNYAQREALASDADDFRGGFIPNETNTGLLPGWTPAALTPIYGSGGEITLTPGQTYENVIFWCAVNMPRGSSGTGPTLRNYVIAGQDPETIASIDRVDPRDGVTKTWAYGAANRAVRCAEADTLPFVMEDGVINPSLWFDPAANPPGGARTGDPAYKLRSSLAFRGGHGTLKRVQIVGAQDGIGLAMADSATNGSNRLDILGCWVHGLLYYTGPDHWQPEGTHTDGIQAFFGFNVHILGSRIEVGHNAGAMLQDESTVYRFDNIELAHTIFEPAPGASSADHGYGINHGIAQDNDFEDSSVHDNVFIGLGSKAIIAKTRYLWAYSDNRVATWDVPGESFTLGAPVSITNGGA